MRTAVIPARELSGDLAARWAEIQQSNPGLASPFFRPEFTRAVASVRDDVFVAILDDGEAFFPFQRGPLSMGRPVGGMVSDYHGLIAGPGYSCDALSLMKACGLRNWAFDHVPAEQLMFAPWHTTGANSPVVDLEQDALAGSVKVPSDLKRQRRKLEREVGPVEVELETCDLATLEWCIEWKSRQYLRTGMPDVFARPWIRSLIETIASHRDPEFAGMLSVLRAGGQRVAAHFGMRSEGVWHYWFPTYDPQFQRYSPGMLLLVEMIAGAPGLGIKTIDFGKGDEDYKLRVSNRMVPLIEGTVSADPLVFQLSKGITKLRSIVQTSPLLKFVLTPAYRIYLGTKLKMH